MFDLIIARTTAANSLQLNAYVFDFLTIRYCQIRYKSFSSRGRAE
ncbi:hypothetical protein CPter291_1430 [Collimonas pratensis]|uniref:Uncharacterized protein n=1 Tax=Collimonas pratensis TaxID=279113 RepID=A0ABN4M7Z7_9BURK|nr:hypothetical protein CPter291_1430 [Collimonas pratensis]